MNRTAKYWDNRAIKRLSEAERTSEAYITRIKKIYDKAYRNIKSDLESVYTNYSKDTGLDVAELKKLLSAKETSKQWEEMRRQGLDKYVKNNYKSRISRLEQIQAQIYAKAKEIYPQEELEQTMCYQGVVNDSYYRTIYDVQKGTGYDFSFSNIDRNLTNVLLNERWSGKNYSQRIWTNTDILAESLSEIVGGGLLSGQSIARTSKLIRDRFGVAKYYAERLVRTETNHFNNEADAMAYEEMGIDKYVFVATLDSRTSPICQDMDNKVFDYKDREVGTNFPPMHPNCRSKTRGYLGDELEEKIRRRAIDPKTGKAKEIGNISYKEWINKNNIVKTRNNMITTNDNIIYNNDSLNELDERLVNTNRAQLESLLKKYPKVANFVKERGLHFGGQDTSAIAVTSHTYDMKQLGIHLSNTYYKDYDKYIKTVSDGVDNGWFMPCSKNNIDKYALTHEFGHLVETYLINVYNIANPSKYNNFIKNINNASSRYQATKVIKEYEKNICDKIARDIYGIARSNNKDFNLSDNLSKYGYEKSQEFFAECFANMECGKPNKLGKAMRDYLKGVM